MNFFNQSERVYNEMEELNVFLLYMFCADRQFSWRDEHIVSCNRKVGLYYQAIGAQTSFE